MKKNNFLQGAFIATLCLIFTKILGVLYVIPFYSIVGPTGSVIYGASYNIYAIFLNLSTVGLPLAISKMVSEYHTLGYEHTKRKVYKIASRFMIVTSIITTILLFIFAPFLAKYIINYNDYTNLAHSFGGELIAYSNYLHGQYLIKEIAFVIRVSATAIFFVTLISMIRGYLQGMKYISASSFSQVIEQFVRVVVILVGSYTFLYVFDFSLGMTVGIAVFGATLGAIVAFFYLRHKKSQIVEEYDEIKDEEKEITTKVLIKKIITYTIPLIIMEMIGTSFQLVDMFTVVSTLTKYAGYTLDDASIVMNVVTTLGNKLNVIVVAISHGIVVSLLPSLTSDFVKGNMEEVSNKINKTIQIIFFMTIPMSIGLSLLAEPVWMIFYGESFYGPRVFMVSVLVAIFSSMFTNIVVTMQSLNRYRDMYIAMFVGFIFNAIMNVPFMIMFHKIGLPIYYGNLVATMIGYLFTILISLWSLKRAYKFSYKRTVIIILKIILSTTLMAGVILLFNGILPMSGYSRMMSIPIVALYTVIGMIVYFASAHLTGLLKAVIDESVITQIFGKKKR